MKFYDWKRQITEKLPISFCLYLPVIIFHHEKKKWSKMQSLKWHFFHIFIVHLHRFQRFHFFLCGKIFMRIRIYFRCHDKHGRNDCGLCSLSPKKKEYCPCGRTLIAELGKVTRTSCTDPIPTCKNVCGKVLACGSKGICELLSVFVFNAKVVAFKTLF